MAKILLIGDSNMNRSIDASVLSAKINATVELYPCTNEVTLDCLLESVKQNEHHVVILSVLSNFIGSLGQDLEPTIMSLFERFFAKIIRLPGRLFLVPPVLRFNMEWYAEKFNVIMAGLEAAIKPYPRVTLLPEFRVAEVDLEKDKLHFTKVTSQKFLDFIISILRDLDQTGAISAPPIEPSTVDEVLSVLKTQVLPVLGPAAQADRKVDQLSKVVLERFSNDDLMFSRIREELDYKTNLGKANRMVFINVKAESLPDKLSENKAFLMTKLKPLIASVHPNAAFEVYPRRGQLRDGMIPPFEVKLGTPQLATAFRRQCKLRSFPGFERAVVAPCVTLATRVRFEVLNSISQKLSDPSLRGYAPMFSIRPVLHVGPEVNGKVVPRSTLLFTDAVEKYGGLVGEDDLKTAYLRAGQFFRGTMRQHFVVLKDVDNNRKRGRSPEAAGSETSKEQPSKRLTQDNR